MGLPLAAPAEAPAEAPITYRLSTDADGPAIGRLFKAADYGDLGVDWARTDVTRGWLLAVRGAVVVGAIQIFMGQPFSVIGDCVVHPAERARAQDGRGRFGGPGRVTLSLYALALKALGDAGSQIACGVTRKAGLARILGRYGGVPLGPCESFAKKLGGAR